MAKPQKVIKYIPLRQISPEIVSEEEATIKGWVTNCRVQKSIAFLEIRDGTTHKLFQVVLTGPLATSAKEEGICIETALCITGKLVKSEKAKGGVEMKATSYEVVGKSDPSYNTLLDHASSAAHKRKVRHLSLREQQARHVLLIRAKILLELRNFYNDCYMTEVEPPSIVMNQVEGGSTLFTVDYFGEKAYLTQSSQLYLESLVPVVGDCYSIMTNYRAEKSHTRRHLSEYTHAEIELGFIDFEDLLKMVERTLIELTERVLAKMGDEIEQLNPGFAAKFTEYRSTLIDGKLKRITHKEAIEFCNDNGILNEDGKPFEQGEDISESPERKMIEMIGEPVLLIKFPADQKPFYMTKCGEGMKETESVDLLVPGVGEILGGSMREPDYEYLVESFTKKGLDVEKYKWYLDLRKYGHGHTGGYGLGVDRLLCWILGRDNIRDVVAYPRYIGNCTP